MFLFPKGAGPPAVAEPTSLLTLVAVEFAPRVAALWPAPHTAFLTASAARRHLVCMALACGRDPACHTALEARLPHAVATALGTPPAGLARALTRMGDVAWAAEDYRMLLRLLADPKAGKTLRHAEVLEAATLRRLALLPAPMAGAVHLAMGLSDDGAVVLREAYEALRLRDGPAAAEAAAARWARAEFARTAFDAVRDDLAPELGPPPHPGTARLRPLASKWALRDAARRYRNCLADHLPPAALGQSAYYEWAGPPEAVVQVSRDHVFGWRLNEVRTARNGFVPQEARGPLLDDLALMGVHVGRSGWDLHSYLNAEVGIGYALPPPDDAFEY